MQNYSSSSNCASSDGRSCDATSENKTLNLRRAIGTHAIHAFGLALSRTQASPCDQSRRSLAHRSARPRYAFAGDRGGKFDHHRSSVELASSQFTIDLRRRKCLGRLTSCRFSSPDTTTPLSSDPRRITFAICLPKWHSQRQRTSWICRFTSLSGL